MQLGLFDERNLLEIISPDFPGERLVACRNPELAKKRTYTSNEANIAAEAALCACWPTMSSGICVRLGKS